MSTLIVDDLKRDRADALRYFAADGSILLRPYAPGKWTARMVLVHLADAVGVQYDRLRRLQADDKPLLWAFDQNRWATFLDYEHRDLVVASALFVANLDAVIELAQLVPADRFERSGIHSEAGRKTFGEVLAFVHWHNRHHLDQVEAAVAAKTWGAQG
jgi:DinB superfamily